MVITDERLKEIRKKISCLQYGEWGHLPLDVRKTIEALVRSAEMYRSILSSIFNLPDCHTCAIKKDCKFCPKWGEPVRINCPLHVERKEKKK